MGTVVPAWAFMLAPRVAGGGFFRARTHTQLEIGPLCIDVQPIGIGGAAFVLGVAQVEIVEPVLRNRDAEPRVRVMRGQAGALIFMIVVHRQLPAVCVGQLEHGIQGGVQPAGFDFREDLTAGTAFETEDIPIAGLVNATVDDQRRLDSLRVTRLVVRLFLKAVRQRVHGKRHLINDAFILEHGYGVHSQASVSGVQVEFVDREIPAS